MVINKNRALFRFQKKIRPVETAFEACVLSPKEKNILNNISLTHYRPAMPFGNREKKYF